MVDLLEEISKNDEIFNSLGYGLSQHGIKIIIVRETEPTEVLRNTSIYFTDYIGNEVCFLKENIFSSTNKWRVQSNLKEARILFCFSQQMQLDEDDIK